MTNIEYEKNIIRRCFLNKEDLLFCIEKIHSENVFSDSHCRIYWQIFSMIYKQNVNICESTVEDILKFTNHTELTEDFKETVSGTYKDGEEWKYQLEYILEQYKKKVLLVMANDIIKNIGKNTSTDLSNAANMSLQEVNSSDIKSVSFREAYRSTVRGIKNIKDGNARAMLDTGHKNFDKVVGLSEKKLIILAAQKKIGKSRFIVDLMDRVCTWNSNIAIQWYSLEMQSDELIRCFVSRRTKLDESELLGKVRKLTDTEMTNIEAAYSYFEKYPIEFIDEPVNIFNITSKFERFKQQHATKHCICIIDNLGLIKPHIKEDNSNEDDISRMLKNLRDSTSSTIIVLHHLTKESESKWNKESGYEPKLTHIRGSSRIVDFANQVLLLHRPDNYPDLVEAATRQGMEKRIRGVFIVDVAANRSGNVEKIYMQHEIQHCMFYEKSEKQIQNNDEKV